MSSKFGHSGTFQSWSSRQFAICDFDLVTVIKLAASDNHTKWVFRSSRRNDLPTRASHHAEILPVPSRVVRDWYFLAESLPSHSLLFQTKDFSREDSICKCNSDWSRSPKWRLIYFLPNKREIDVVLLSFSATWYSFLLNRWQRQCFSFLARLRRRRLLYRFQWYICLSALRQLVTIQRTREKLWHTARRQLEGQSNRQTLGDVAIRIKSHQQGE